MLKNLRYQQFFSQSTSKYWIFIFLLVGFFLRIIFINSLRLDYDEGLFLYIANLYNDSSIIDGITSNYINFFDIPLNQPPVVAFVYSLIYSIFPLDYGYGRIFNVIVGTVCISLIYLVVKNVWDYKTGLVAALMVTIDPTLVMGVLVNMDALTWFFLCLSLFGMVKAIKINTYRWHVFSGTLFGLSMLTKWNLAIIPITYVFIFTYYSLKINKQRYYEFVDKIILATIVAFAIFLPWVFFMIFSERFDVLFMHVSRFTPLAGLNSIFQTWSHSPFILFFTIFSFLYYFISESSYRIPLLYGLLIILPFYLIMPRYYDFTPFLFLCIILLSKPLLFFIEKSLEFLLEVRNGIFKIGEINIDMNKVLPFTLVFVMISVNFGMIFQEAVFDDDQTVQKTMDYLAKNIPENATIISTPEYITFISPRTFIHLYTATIGNNYYLIYSNLNTQTTSFVTEGVLTGFSFYNNINYTFQPLTRINDVTIYKIFG